MTRFLGLGGALGAALALLVPQRLAQAQDLEQAAPIPPPSTQTVSPEGGNAAAPPPITADELAAIRAELSRHALELNALKAREQERARSNEASSARLSGYVQVDFVPYNQASQNEISYSTGTPLNQNRFLLRRGRLRLDATQKYLAAVLELDANTINGAQVRPIDAEVAFRWPDRAASNSSFVEVSAGLMKIPFGFEVPEHDAVRPFLERSTVGRALFPGARDLGAKISVHHHFLDLSMAIMNGYPIADRAFPALAPNAHKELVGRLGVSKRLTPSLQFDVGLSIDSGEGFHQGTPTTKDQLQWNDENGDGIVQATEVQVISGSSATASSQFRRFALGADARLAFEFATHAEFAVRAELIRASNLDRGLEVADPVGAGYDLRELGWYIGATQEVTKWAVLGVRYDHYDPDQDANEQRAALRVPQDRSYSSLALLAMLRWETARLSCEYDINRNSLGRDASGAPANLESDSLTFRAQMRF